uniref:Uncharacterized protein n=1 Tax=Anguilla anguilla TaxID=7936 RepID=A0A0E9VHG4_ANGAN
MQYCHFHCRWLECTFQLKLHTSFNLSAGYLSYQSVQKRWLTYRSA